MELRESPSVLDEPYDAEGVPPQARRADGDVVTVQLIIDIDDEGHRGFVADKLRTAKAVASVVRSLRVTERSSTFPIMANERARQKKLERKQLKREEKRRALRAGLNSGSWTPPAMSLTLKRFAEPLLERLPDEADADDWKVVLNFAAMVWNASDAEPSEKMLTLGRDLFDALGWEGDVAEELRVLRARKTAQFGWEPRMVAGVEVEDRGDTMHVVGLSMLA